jgi:hypothetical protein
LHRNLTAVLALFALAAAAPSPAAAASRDTIIKDCSDDGRLQGKYTASELRDARKNLPSDISEYTDCADVLRRAELPSGGSSSSSGGTGTTSGGSFSGGGTTGGGGSSTPLTPATDAERQALAKAGTTGDAPVKVNGTTVVPGAAGFSPNAPRNGLPDNLLIALLALALLGVGAIAAALRGRSGDFLPGRGA